MPAKHMLGSRSRVALAVLAVASCARAHSYDDELKRSSLASSSSSPPSSPPPAVPGAPPPFDYSSAALHPEADRSSRSSSSMPRYPARLVEMAADGDDEALVTDHTRYWKRSREEIKLARAEQEFSRLVDHAKATFARLDPGLGGER